MLNKLFSRSVNNNRERTLGFSSPRIRLTIWLLLSWPLHIKQNTTSSLIWSTGSRIIESLQTTNTNHEKDSSVVTKQAIDSSTTPRASLPKITIPDKITYKVSKKTPELLWNSKISLNEVDFSTFESDLAKASDLVYKQSNFKDWSTIIVNVRDKVSQYASTLTYDEWYKKHPKREQFEKHFSNSFNILIYSLWSLSEYDKLSRELDKILALNIINEFSDANQVQLYSRIWFALSFLNNADLSVSYYDKAYNLYFEKESQIQNWEFSYNLFMRILTYKLVTIDQIRTAALDNIHLWASIGTSETDVLESYKERLDQIAHDFNPKIIDFDFNISQEDNYKLFVDKYINNKNKANPNQDANLIMFRRIWTNIFSIQYEYFNQKHLQTEIDSEKYLLSLDRIMNMLYVMEKHWFQINNGPAHTELIRAKILLHEWEDSLWYKSLKKSLALCLSKDFKDRDLALDIVSYYLRYIDKRDIKIDKEIIAIFLEKQPDEVDLDAAIEALRSITKKNIDQKFGVITTMNTLYSQLEILNEELWEKNEIITQQYDQVLDLYAKLSQEYTIKATQNRIIENQRDSLTIINKSERRAKEEAIEAKEKESMANEALNKSNEIQKRLSYVLSFFILLVIFLLWQQIQLKLKERKLKEEERDKKQQVIEEIKNMAPNEAYYNHIYSKLSWLEWATKTSSITLYQQVWSVLDVSWHSKIVQLVGQKLYSELIDESLQVFNLNNLLHLETSEWDDVTFTYHANFPQDLEKQNHDCETQSLLNYLHDLAKIYQVSLPEKNKNNILEFLPSIRYKGYFSMWEITYSYLSGKFNYKWSMYNNWSRWGSIFQWRNGIVFFLDKWNSNYPYLKNTLINYLESKWIFYRMENKESDEVDGEIIQFYITPELHIVNPNDNIRLSAYNILKKDKTKDNPDTQCEISISKLYIDKNWICYGCNFSDKKLENNLKKKSGSKVSLTINWKSAFGTYEPLLGRFCFAYIDPTLERNIMMLYSWIIMEPK